MSGGRPTKLSEELIQTLAKWVRTGAYITTVCQAHDISRETYYAWMRRGEEEQEGLYREFSDTLKRAEAEAELRLLARLEQCADPQADGPFQRYAWILERRFRDRWGRSPAVVVEQAKERKLRHVDNGALYAIVGNAALAPRERMDA